MQYIEFYLSNKTSGVWFARLASGRITLSYAKAVNLNRIFVNDEE